MRTERQQQELDNIKRKFHRTAKAAFQERGTLVQDYGDYYVTVNEYPHMDRGEDQLVLRANRDWKDKRTNLQFILQQRTEKDYKIFVSKNKNKSVKDRRHLHFYK